MKTILHLSILLMLLAGVAGALNFFKMFRSGEIDKIYTRDENTSPALKVEQSPAVLPTASSVTVMDENASSAVPIRGRLRGKKGNDLNTLLQMRAPLAIRKEVESTPISLIEVQEFSAVRVSLNVQAPQVVKAHAEEMGILAEFSRAPLRKIDIAEEARIVTADSTAASASNENSTP